jgi:hypothetical protein
LRSQIKPWKTLFAVVLLAAAGVVGSGCGAPSGQSLCDAEAQCKAWNFGEIDSCYREADEDEFFADRLGCGGFLDDLHACEEATAFCSSGRDWDTNCKIERDRWHSCSGH